MNNCLTTLLIFSAAATAQAQPVIKTGGVVNSASYAAAALPNGAIAQGSLFVVFGSGLGPAALQQVTSYPLSTALAGTSLAVTVNGATTSPFVIYTSAGQVAAILPSTTPVGAGTVSLSYNGQTSAPVPIQVAASSFGIYSANQAGNGAGIITDTNYRVAGLTSAANAGEAFILWGTGLGPATGDESGPGSGLKVGLIPVEVLVAGKSASVLGYARSSAASGLDQIAFTVPAGVTGCSAPVAVKIGDVVSNYVSLAIASSGRTCSDPAGIPTVTVSGTGTVSIGSISLSRSTISTSLLGGTVTTTTDTGVAGFTKFNYSAYASTPNPYQLSTYGSCTVFSFAGVTATAPTVANPINLDAGPSLSVNGPNGTKTLTKMSGAYFAQLGGGGINLPGAPASTPLYLSKGSYSVTGTGGADVGPLTAMLNVPDPLNWTNAAAVSTVTRRSGQPITWTGSDPAGMVYITGASFAGATIDSLAGAVFVCVERAAAGQFTIPSAVLLSLPPSSSTIGGSLSVIGGAFATFKANGLDQGSIGFSSGTSQSVTYQ